MNPVTHGEAIPGGRKMRVLIADDSAAIRTSLGALISRIPNVEVVGAARSGLQALEMLRRHKPDILTLDLRMPELSGIGVLEALRREKVEVMTIVLSDLEEQEYRQKCLELGAAHFFHKATQFEKVIEILSQISRPAPPDS